MVINEQNLNKLITECIIEVLQENSEEEISLQGIGSFARGVVGAGKKIVNGISQGYNGNGTATSNNATSGTQNRRASSGTQNRNQARMGNETNMPPNDIQVPGLMDLVNVMKKLLSADKNNYQKIKDALVNLQQPTQ